MKRARTRARILRDLEYVEQGIRLYYRERRDRPELLQGMEARKRELEAALRRTPPPLPPTRWGNA